MGYVDGFVAAVPESGKDAFRAHSAATSALFKEYGALSIVDCWGDDVPDGKLTSFPMAVKKEEGETVVFSWVLWPDKATRNAAMQKLMEDERMRGIEMPFDGKRLIYGGFEVISEA